MKSLFPEEVRFKRDQKDEYALTRQVEGGKDIAKETSHMRAVMGERTELETERRTGAD